MASPDDHLFGAVFDAIVSFFTQSWRRKHRNRLQTGYISVAIGFAVKKTSNIIFEAHAWTEPHTALTLAFHFYLRNPSAKISPVSMAISNPLTSNCLTKKRTIFRENTWCEAPQASLVRDDHLSIFLQFIAGLCYQMHHLQGHHNTHPVGKRHPTGLACIYVDILPRESLAGTANAELIGGKRCQ